MDKYQQELINVLTRCRNVKTNNNRKSKAASFFATENINKAQLIHNFINDKH